MTRQTGGDNRLKENSGASQSDPEVQAIVDGLKRELINLLRDEKERLETIEDTVPVDFFQNLQKKLNWKTQNKINHIIALIFFLESDIDIANQYVKSDSTDPVNFLLDSPLDIVVQDVARQVSVREVLSMPRGVMPSDAADRVEASLRERQPITFAICADNKEEYAHRFCLHFQTESDVYAFWEFCVGKITEKIEHFIRLILDGFCKSAERDFDTWFSLFDVADLYSHFIRCDFDGIKEIFKAKTVSSAEIKVVDCDELREKIRKKFQTTHYNTGSQGCTFDLLVAKPVYFGELLSSRLTHHGVHSNKKYGCYKFEAMLVKEQLWLLRDEIGCGDIDPDKLESPYSYFRCYYIDDKKLEHVKIIICPSELDQHLKAARARLKRDWLVRTFHC